MHNDIGATALKTPNLNDDIHELIKAVDGLLGYIDAIADRLDGPQPETPCPMNGAVPPPFSGLSAVSARIKNTVSRVASAEGRLSVVDRRLGF